MDRPSANISISVTQITKLAGKRHAIDQALGALRADHHYRNFRRLTARFQRGQQL